MKTEHEIYDLIHDAMLQAMRDAWDALPADERQSYSLRMHGIEMAVSKRKAG